MLRHEPSIEESSAYSSSPPRSALVENTRVTTDELIAAVAEIEARRDASQRWQANTIALSDAVQQLGLNMTPEELLAEVEAVRSRRYGEAQQNAMASARRRSMRSVWVLVAVMVLIPILLIFFSFSTRARFAMPQPATPMVAPPVPTVFVTPEPAKPGH